MVLAQGALKVKMIVAHSPPAPWDRGQLPMWRSTVSKLAAWVRKEVVSTPSRFTPLLFMDLNDKFQQGPTGDEVVGPFPTGNEGEAGKIYHKLLHETHMTAANTHYPTGATYEGHGGSGSVIDYI